MLRIRIYLTTKYNNILPNILKIINNNNNLLEL